MITVECSHCHKRYNAPDTLAGKKIKCKHCGRIFGIPADLDSADNITGLELLTRLGNGADEPTGESPAAEPAPAPTAQKPDTRPKAKPPSEEEPQKIGDPGKGYATRLQRKEGTQDIDLTNEPAPLAALRPSVPFDFPGAYHIDRFAPVGLALVGLGLLALMAVNSNLTGESWVGTLRLGIFILLFFAVVLPIGWMGIRWAARKLRFGMPPAAVGRAIGAFAVPFGIAIAMWLGSQSIGVLIFGTVLGALAAAGAVWLLFRLQPQEISTGCPAAAVAFGFSVAFTFGLLVLVNMAVETSAKNWPTNTLAVSPIAPNLSWDVPLKTRSGTNALAQGTLPDQPDTQPAPATNETTTPATTQSAPDTQSATTVAVIPSATEPATRSVVQKPPVEPPPATRTTAPPQTRTAVVTTTQKTIADPPPVTTSSPLVAQVTSLAGPRNFDSLLFSPGNSQVLAAIKSTADSDTIDLWSINPSARKATAKFAREKDVPPTYALSNSGDWLARIIAWPKMAIGIWSFSEDKVIRTVPLDTEETTAPRLFAFTPTDAVVMSCPKPTLVPFAVLAVKPATPLRLGAFSAAPYEATAGNPSLSPDGRLLAVAADVQTKGEISLYDTTMIRKPARTLPVTLTRWVKPAGMAFSPDSKMIAAFFEQQGRGLLVCFRVAETKPFHEHIYATLPFAHEDAEKYTDSDRSFDWLDAQTWLLYGRVLIDVETGKPLGSLEIENVRSQRVIDRQTVLLTIVDGVEKRLVLVKLKPEAIAAARAQLKKGASRPTAP